MCKTATLKKTKNWFSRPIYRFMQVKSIAEYILQYFRPSLNYKLLLRSFFFLSIFECSFIHRLYCIILIDFSLTVKAATLIFITGRGSAISSAKQGKSGSIYNLVKN